MPDIPIGMVPYGRRSDGSLGLFLDPTTDESLVSVMEVLENLPDVADTYNFPGRLVFDKTQANIFVFTDDPSDAWIGLQASAVTIITGEPDLIPTPNGGDLEYSTTTELLYLYDGTQWVAVGGARGASVIWRYYTADGATDQFDTGATTNPPVDYVQVYLDGVVQEPGAVGTRDYYMIGNDVKLNATPSNGVRVVTRTLTFISAARNARFVFNRYDTATDGLNGFDCGIQQADPAQLFVAVDNVLQTPDHGDVAGTYAYRVDQQDNTAASVTSSGTTVTFNSNEAHGFTVGDTVTVAGANETAYNITTTVTEVVDSDTFRYVADSTPSASPATTATEITFSPLKRNDIIYFVNSGSGADEDLPSGAIVTVRALENVAVGAENGEINTGANVGGGVGVFKDKNDTTLRFKSLVAGDGVTLTAGTNTITITAEDSAFISKIAYNGSPSTYTVGDTEAYIAVRNSSGAAVNVDLGDIALGGGSDGRSIIIKDEAGNAATHQINIVPDASSKIDGGGVGSNFVINDNYGGVFLTFDGTDWHVLYREPGVTGPAGPTGATGPSGLNGNWAQMTRTEIDGTTDPYVMQALDEYIAVTANDGTSVTIDIFTSVDAGDAGRTVIVKDEDRNASATNILIDPGAGRSIDGGTAGTALTMNTDGAYVRLMWDGANWHTIG